MPVAADLRVLYRGPLASCDYSCWYCPFAKRVDDRAALDRDAAALRRFTTWIARRTERVGVLFTPWGEALIRPAYREAMVELSHERHVVRVGAQTNLSFHPEWVAAADLSALALWCTYHPDQVPLHRFLSRCKVLTRLGVTYTVGVVGLRENFRLIDALRVELPDDVYLWVNAYKSEPNYYREGEVERLRGVDPLFEQNAVRHRSLGLPCEAGARSVTVDGDGVIRRCHFVDVPIGHIDDPSWAPNGASAPCPNQTCGCYIGYVNLEAINAERWFTDPLVRLPRRATAPSRQDAPDVVPPAPSA